MSSPSTSTPAPLELLFELVRSQQASDPFHFRLEPQEYLLRRAQGSYARAAFGWESALLEDLAELERPQPDRSVVQRLGDRLRVFLEELGWEEHARDILAATEQQRPVHLTFRFAAAELYALPWELLTLGASGRALAEVPKLLIRYEWPSAPTTPPPRTSRNGRILYAWSAAGGQVPDKAHLRALTQASAEGAHTFDPSRDVVPHASLTALSEALARPGEPVTILHVLCHGNRRGQTYGLLLDPTWEGGEPELVDGAALRQALAPHASTLRLVVLSACQSGVGLAGNHLGSVAQSLHRAGIQSVVASRLPLSIAGSVALTEVLYRSLLVGSRSLEESVGQARRELARVPTSLDYASLQLYARAEDGSDTRPVTIRPYRGLLPFEKQDRRFFFGRERLLEELIQRIQESLDGRRPRFQVLAGASGSGKSSLALAGLQHALPASTWDVQVLRPGQGNSQELLERAPTSPGRQRLLIVDPLEELFTQIPLPEARSALGAALWKLSRDPKQQVVVLGTIRVDYLGRCGEVIVDDAGTRLDAAMYSDDHRLFVTTLQGDDLRAAIVGPAHAVGLTFEPGLVDRLLQDVGQEPGALPLLQYALDQLWELREGAHLTHGAYATIGGVAGALTRAAERLYAGLTPDEKRQVRRLLVELVDFQPGASPGTRRRGLLPQLRPTEEPARETFERTLNALLDARLLLREEGTAGEEWLVLSHESLIRTWPALAEWAAADRERLQHLRELRTWAREWRAHRQDPDGGVPYLLSGSRLGYAQRVLELYDEAPGADVLDHLEASEARDESRQRTERQRMFALVAVALGVAATMAGLAWNAREHQAQEQLERERAQESAGHARDLLLLGVARTVMRDNPTLALLMLREVREPEKLPHWDQEAAEVLQHPLSQALLRGHEKAVVHVELSPDGQHVVTASLDKTARIWRTDGRGDPVVLVGHEGPLYHATFSRPDGALVLTSSHDGTARLWRSSDGQLLRVFHHRGSVQWGAFSPDGQRIATASWDGMARVWPRETAGEPLLFRHPGRVSTVAFSPDGKSLLTASQDGKARLLSLEAPDRVREWPHDSPVNSATFDPDGSHVLTVSRDGLARVWPVSGTGSPVLLKGHQGEITSARFSPDGQWVATGSVDNTARLWRADGRGEPRVLRGHQDAVRMVAFSGPSGGWLLTVSSDTTARLWPMHPTGSPRILRGHRSTVLWGAFDAAGTRVVTGSADATARVWSLEMPRDSLPLPSTGGFVWSVAFSPDASQVATASQDGGVRLWSADGRLLQEMRGHTQDVRSVVFSQDGKWLLTASPDGTARLWPANGSATGRRVLVTQKAPIFGAAFSPDGLWVALATDAGATRILRVDGSKPPIPLEGHGAPIRSVTFSADGRRVLTASQDGTARVWTAEGRLLATLYGHDDWVLSAAFHPKDPTQILTSSQDGTARIWRVEGTKVHGVRLIARHEAPVLWAAWSPQGNRFITACADARARVWLSGASPSLVEVREPHLVLSAHEDNVTSAAFSPRETDAQVVTGSTDGSARLWLPREPRSVEALVENLRSASSACLTPGEREAQLGDPWGRSRRDFSACEQVYGRHPSGALP